MKIAELKLRVITGLNGFIDEYFGDMNLTDKFINATLKLLVKQNTNKYDHLLNMFADENGEINSNELLQTYSGMIGEKGITFDLKQYVGDSLGQFIPNKVLIIKQEDLVKMLS
jgi:hypothetical protein